MQRPSGSAANFTAPVGSREEPEIEEAFDRLVTEGGDRLSRPLLPLLSTGFLGGIDVGVGVLAYLVVRHETGSSLLGALAFTIGFVALLLSSGAVRSIVARQKRPEVGRAYELCVQEGVSRWDVQEVDQCVEKGRSSWN